MTPPDLTVELKKYAQELGFALSGACPAVSPHGITRLASWLAAGYAGEMSYLADRFEAYRHPRSVLDGVRSLLMLGMPYHTRSAVAGRGRGGTRVALRVGRGGLPRRDSPSAAAALSPGASSCSPRCACAASWTRRRCWSASSLSSPDSAGSARTRCCSIVRPGSWFFLAALLLDCELDYDRAVAPPIIVDPARHVWTRVRPRRFLNPTCWTRRAASAT